MLGRMPVLQARGVREEAILRRAHRRSDDAIGGTPSAAVDCSFAFVCADRPLRQHSTSPLLRPSVPVASRTDALGMCRATGALDWEALASALYERGLVVKPPFVLRRDGAPARGGRPPAWMLAEPRPDGGVPAKPKGRGWGSRLERCSSLYRFVKFEDQV